MKKIIKALLRSAVGKIIIQELIDEGVEKLIIKIDGSGRITEPMKPIFKQFIREESEQILNELTAVN